MIPIPLLVPALVGISAAADLGYGYGRTKERKRHALYTETVEKQIRQLELDRADANARADTWRKSAGDWRRAFLEAVQVSTQPASSLAPKQPEEEERDQPLSVRENDKRVANERRASDDRTIGTAMTTMMPVRTNDPEALPVPHLSTPEDLDDVE